MAEILKILYVFIIFLSLILAVISQHPFTPCETNADCKCRNHKRPDCLWHKCYCY
ncbi:putative Late nodulin [Medicago truncatula]|uniref:Late nodulin n=1 Tax=Medicago truncatula TaxID=3880 RepID=A7KHC2_MEDTR|nr:nodule-specific cysteine-rich peptide 221 [Medicago truncatula]AES69475.1 late nodulin [Medicago truncatula]AFK40436.1 unknown [Medicago truncatula]RHN66264.1 putative Late nodulin [Medicago truncatula]